MVCPEFADLDGDPEFVQGFAEGCMEFRDEVRDKLEDMTSKWPRKEADGTPTDWRKASSRDWPELVTERRKYETLTTELDAATSDAKAQSAKVILRQAVAPTRCDQRAYERAPRLSGLRSPRVGAFVRMRAAATRCAYAVAPTRCDHRAYERAQRLSGLRSSP